MSVKTTIAELPVTEPVVEPGYVSLFMELIKARLTFLVLLTTLVGFYLGSAEPIDWILLTNTLGGTSLLAAGASALNQLLEREHDARMKRTRSRPLPAGHMSPNSVLALGVAMIVGGLIWLALGSNLLAAALGSATVASYLFIYTPLKRVTVLNTIVGAVPGALPPLIGWAGATNELSRPGWALFAIVFFWQLPHFMAICWLYRDEYSGAGFRMLSGEDPEGRRTAASAIRNTLALIVVSLFPFTFTTSGTVYLAAATLLGFAFLAFAIRFARHLSPRTARQLFFASILYLPLLLGALVFDKSKKLTPPLGTLDKMERRLSTQEESEAAMLAQNRSARW